ncbi:MAG TPA: alpha/beta hydrolase [Roseiarcus sp.]|jgi:pimeloyl-ACP methyl ester carboxylesterase|nr:alpha/beta hydrolase [Roseiarcus sp.]
MRLSVVCLAMAIGPALSATALAQSPRLATTEAMIQSSDPNIKLYVRNKHPEGVASFSPDKTLLFIHGATYPAETSFDLPIEGVSMMDMFAQNGFDVYLVDVRSYGRSSRPPEMDQPPEANKPIATSEEAGEDLRAAVDHILALRGIPKLDLMGWSWGTSIAGKYTAEHNDKINRLVLYAPAWTFRPAVEPPASPLPAYRLVAREDAKARWLKGVPEDKQATLIPPGVFDAWWNATLATDPVGSKMNPPRLRAANGVMAEFVNHWVAGKPFYDPGKISVPTLLIHAEWDADLPTYMTEAYFAKLTGAPYKRFVQLGEGTHTVMMEKNRMQFFHEILGFLDESGATALK